MNNSLRMIAALMAAQWRSLLRDRMALALSFALPCVMFTVFAVIFGGSGNQREAAKLKVVIVDQDQSRVSGKMIRSLKSMDQLQVEPLEPDPAEQDVRLSAARIVKSGRASAAIVFPAGLATSLGIFGGADSARSPVEIIYDPANPIAQQMLTGVIQASAFTSAPDVLMTQGLDQFRTFGGGFTPMQETALVTLKQLLSDETDAAATANTTDTDAATTGNSPGSGFGLSMSDGLVKISATAASELLTESAAKGSRITGQNMISYYAAGISVMFIMFSMSGAASSLLEHEEKGTLERMLSGGLTVFRLLVAHWLYYVLFGVTQIGLMLVFASVAFGLDLWHVPTVLGSLVMATVSSMASASFILMVATLCRSRKQLEGLSSIIILVMSAIGGSMMPRFIMPAFVLKLSGVAFNSWAMDGFLDVFWHHIPGENILAAIAPEAGIILAMTAVFLCIASLSSRRWSAR
jgi:ABC-2 type transport system permease protein